MNYQNIKKIELVMNWENKRILHFRSLEQYPVGNNINDTLKTMLMTKYMYIAKYLLTTCKAVINGTFTVKDIDGSRICKISTIIKSIINAQTILFEALQDINISTHDKRAILFFTNSYDNLKELINISLNTLSELSKICKNYRKAVEITHGIQIK